MVKRLKVTQKGLVGLITIILLASFSTATAQNDNNSESMPPPVFSLGEPRSSDATFSQNGVIYCDCKADRLLNPESYEENDYFPALPDTIEGPCPRTAMLLRQEPRPVNMPKVRERVGYPKASKRKRIEGLVVVRVLVNTSGEATHAVIVKDADPELMKAVADHVFELEFKPAVQAGKPIAAWVTLPFRFE